MIELLNDLMKVIFYGTIAILVFGIFIIQFHKTSSSNKPIFHYLTIVLFVEVTAFLLIVTKIIEQNLFLFSISAFIHFVFLIYFFHKKIPILKHKIAPKILLVLGAILFLLGLSQNLTADSFSSYDRALFSFSIAVLTLIYFYFVTLGKLKYKKIDFILNVAIFLFFATDTFLAIGSNILVNENLELVAGFWMFRALFLQLYYISLIYHAWQTGKTPLPLSNG